MRSRGSGTPRRFPKSRATRDSASVPASQQRRRRDRRRVYFVTLLTCAVMLAGLDRFELFVDPLLGLKRTVLIAFPASFAAMVVDSIG